MLKYLFSLILSLFFISTVSAQTERDTLIYYVKNDGTLLQNKQGADYVLLIMPVSQPGKTKLYPLLALYPDGKRKMIASSSVRSLKFVLEGTQMMFFPNGKRSVVTTYNKGVPFGDEISYYPNGSFYKKQTYQKGKPLLVDCRDSTGAILTENGNGKWIEYDQSFSYINEEGPVKDGLREGIWTTPFQKETYQKGLLKSYHVTSLPKSSIITDSYSYSDSINLPGQKNLRDTLNRFIANNLDERTKKLITGRQMYAQFSVTQQGALYNFEVFNSPSLKFTDELIRAISLSSPWPSSYVEKQPIYMPILLPIYIYANSLAPSLVKDSLNSKVILLDGKVYVPVEKTPEFPGGPNAFTKFLEKTVKYPEAEKTANVQGKVYIAFIVDKDGSISDPHVLKTSSIGLAEEALRVVKLSPKWIPAILNGQPVRVAYTVPINFTLGESFYDEYYLPVEIKVGNATYIKTRSGNAYIKVESMPKFSNEKGQFDKFLLSNIHYPDFALKNKISGKVEIAFIVENDGSVTNVEPVASRSLDLSDECIRVIKLSPPWVPGYENGRKVRVRLTATIEFIMSKKSMDIKINNPY